MLNAVSKIDPNLRFFNCIYKKKLGCPGLLHANGDTFTMRTDHTHESVSQETIVNATKGKENIRTGATMCGDDVSTLINEVYDRLHSDEKAILPKKSSLHRMARNKKNKGVAKLPVEPENFDDFGKFMHLLLLSLGLTTL